jgi:cyclophilin family peptidyl-prolyl cis-trans isomerase
LLFLLIAGCTPAINAQQMPDSTILKQSAPDSFQVVFETTKGPFTVTAYRKWSPLGADRLYHLVKHDYYLDVPFYRVIPNTYAQFGFAKDLDVSKAWSTHTIADEPVKASNTYGRISFARTGPNTRSQHLAIMLGNHTHLDTINVNGVTGFVPIGEVTSGMDVVESMNMKYENEPRTHIKIDSAMTRGNAYLRRTFPGLDYIKRAYIKE